MHKTVIGIFLWILATGTLSAQKDEIRKQIEAYKNDVRGPYKDIRWFCEDGSIRPPKDPCPDKIGPGYQHARYKDEVVLFGKKHHIFLGQILTYTDNKELWDEAENHSRLKQYLLNAYLQGIDDGWILRKAQFYRGAIQSEDEETRGIDFYKWLLSNDKWLQQNYFLIRQSLKDIPHRGDTNLAQQMRNQSKALSDEIPSFMDLRVKIHSKPEASDIERVRKFQRENTARFADSQLKKIDELIKTMADFYQPIAIDSLLEKNTLLAKTALGDKISQFIDKKLNVTNPALLVDESSTLLLQIRKGILEEKRPLARLELLDISLKIEEIIFKNAPNYQPDTLNGLLTKICYLGEAAAGGGYIELWEWENVLSAFSFRGDDKISLQQLNRFLEASRSIVEWSASMVKANYQEVVDTYMAFEPKAYGFLDDKIRGSVILQLGNTVGDLGRFFSATSSIKNSVLDLSNQSTLRGLNPGYAFGELVVVDGLPDDIKVSSDKIYIFKRPPSDLKPVAGIATVSEGNMVSHVQLLARNLGIPNAALSDENLMELKKYQGQKIFYAVSNRGNIVMKPANAMNKSEKELFEKKERNQDKIEVPVSKIRLDQNQILNLREVDANDSGALCGPKAANLGQLKKMFPERVVEGLVIPFGIFRDHMDQVMITESKLTYWQFLNTMFTEAEKMRNAGLTDDQVDEYQLKELEKLRGAIKEMPLKTSFVADLENQFRQLLGKELGAIPVFLRSDTNMEDLKDFTGAGLNLTIFNSVDKEKILQGIKDVWASPYTERSFKWRQKYLLNPENVFPSILVIPSVDVDYSGVLITKNIRSGNEKDVTIAFSRGAGGAVDGQSAESYILSESQPPVLIAPARDPHYNRLPQTGGTKRYYATFESAILTNENIKELLLFTKEIRLKFPKSSESATNITYDIELGFKDNKLWLFQVRPFVENKKALSSDYLESITPAINANKQILLSQKLK